MAFEIELHSDAPPERVLAAIRDNSREWHESRIPHDVWTDGVLQVVAELKAPHFRMYCERRWHKSEGGDPLHIKGKVSPDGAGGTYVHARCGHQSSKTWILVLLGGSLAWGLWANGAFSVVLVVAAVTLIVLDAPGDREVSRRDPDAGYLAVRLEEAVASASTSAPQAV